MEFIRHSDDATKRFRRSDITIMQIDRAGRKLLMLLRENARIPVPDLDHGQGVARSTARARIDRMERKGVIAGYALRVGVAGQGADRDRTMPRAGGVGAAAQPAGGGGARTTSGRFDQMVLLAVGTTAELDMTLDWIGEATGGAGWKAWSTLAARSTGYPERAAPMPGAATDSFGLRPATASRCRWSSRWHRAFRRRRRGFPHAPRRSSGRRDRRCRCSPPPSPAGSSAGY